jgi:Trk K+ transport system NAD-binding subunit
MDTIFFLILRRMRAPLLVITVVNTVAVLGMVLAPGTDGQGNSWHMDFFHAFYFVSFMGTTIGFGEIPYPFSGAQRLWATISIYMTVTAWIYTIGTLLALLQDRAFRQALTESRFSRTVAKIGEPFYVVCGYGDTGKALVRSLEERYLRSVVIDIDVERINMLSLEDFPVYVPGLCADAGVPAHLVECGIRNPHCAGLISLTNDSHVNLHVAISGKLLHPDLKVICRSESHDNEANMRSFGTDRVVNPFDTFADHLATAVHSPGLHLLMEWLNGEADELLSEPIYPPKGTWVLCGYGRFGKAIYRELQREGIDIVVIEADPDTTRPPGGSIIGRGTEADTLAQAGIGDAVGLVAGTNDDSNNLSILITATELNSTLFTVLRQNRASNREIMIAAHCDIVVQASDVVASRIRSLLTVPLLEDFLAEARLRDDQWACVLISRLSGMVGDTLPEVWEAVLDEKQASAAVESIAAGHEIRLHQLTSDPTDRDRPLPCLPLLLVRDEIRVTLPEAGEPLRPGDRILYAGSRTAQLRSRYALRDSGVLNYLRTGEPARQSWLWRRLFRPDTSASAVQAARWPR